MDGMDLVCLICRLKKTFQFPICSYIEFTFKKDLPFIILAWGKLCTNTTYQAKKKLKNPILEVSSFKKHNLSRKLTAPFSGRRKNKTVQRGAIFSGFPSFIILMQKDGGESHPRKVGMKSNLFARIFDGVKIVCEKMSLRKITPPRPPIRCSSQISGVKIPKLFETTTYTCPNHTLLFHHEPKKTLNKNPNRMKLSIIYRIPKYHMGNCVFV